LRETAALIRPVAASLEPVHLEAPHIGFRHICLTARRVGKAQRGSAFDPATTVHSAAGGCWKHYAMPMQRFLQHYHPSAPIGTAADAPFVMVTLSCVNGHWRR
jgi:hypothetical protein